jgi:hypothetical protein
MTYLWNNPENTYRIFNYLNKNYSLEESIDTFISKPENSISGGSINSNYKNIKPLSDLEFDKSIENNNTDISKSKITNSTIGGNNKEEYKDVLLPQLETDISPSDLVNNHSKINNESSFDDIKNDIDSTIEQNMSLKTLEEIYGKRHTSKNINENDLYDIYNIEGSDLTSSNTSDDEDSYDSDNSEELIVEAINDKDAQKSIKDFETINSEGPMGTIVPNSMPEVETINDDLDNLYLNNDSEIDDSDEDLENDSENDDSDEDLESKADLEGIADLENDSENELENLENQSGGESINKIIENLGNNQNDEEAYIKGCKAKNLSGGYTNIYSTNFKFYPYK